MLPATDAMLPQWLLDRLATETAGFATVGSRMKLVIDLSRLNVGQGTGGPFGAAVFDAGNGTLIAAGVNRVVPLNNSTAHAEMLAIAAAQQKLGCFDLGAKGMPDCELVTSCEPCAMCFGAIPWSGIRRVVCGATAADAQRIGFDEGPRHPDWVAELEKRGIHVQTGVCRDAAARVLNDYQSAQGVIYNGRVA
ncbi:MAG: tRNA-specific adenosine deaminase [Zetaproteobacteria bacterium CG06_land_8_20_14_3_00_59_53]|nr:MAG: tRNA-specific adenosine deaminase [Zetaproteobacteria bacterium CG23_combo_of_CG06-09_8_20_14_all_59_86]PIQ65216.1 MAG: tRNA-specific adenosine deaminase [Zetaproteobacteria bacterium CG11_big_fil_rev_8_21_14_0_20_59_439]PIU70794.1 MAG: tRNA-specific adenosine deaminase [Zetaproteobacteria bacterium CG06_land_8_20_14_3_00_59_53]PIU96466.1 MAG: tRNA-specific adenosine deaminase [Zetaproteobacteria bacterium CG03_land_8_20_14_0_80_59_51]PIY45338.1 MAG: tRNA-specific adenosine deaminase [Z